MSVASAVRPTRERERRKTARRRSRATPHKPFFEHSARSESIAARSRRLLGRAPSPMSAVMLREATTRSMNNPLFSQGTRVFFALAAAGWLAATAVGSGEEDLFAPSAGDNVVLQWNNACLQAVRDTIPGPTVVARAIAVLHASMFDAWAAYDAAAVATVPSRGWRRPAAEATDANKTEAVSFAAYRALVDLFPAPKEKAIFDALMTQLGYDSANASTDAATPAGVGNAAAAAVLGFRHRDGSNQLGDLHPGAYSDTTGYQAVNTPAAINDPNHWQPLFVVNPAGQVTTQAYTTPHWGQVIPFAMTSGSALRPPPPARYPSAEYASQAADLVAISAGLTDFQKVTAEATSPTAPSSEFPPGHWALFAQFVSRRDHHSLDDDVKMFFALGNALLDAGICAWDAKLAYDSVRPVTAIHFLYAGTDDRSLEPVPGHAADPGRDWRPYQVSTVVTPPFPEFFSGHSVFSAAGAEVLKSFTGSDVLGASVTISRAELRRRTRTRPGDGHHALVSHFLQRRGRGRDVPPLGWHPFRARGSGRPVGGPHHRGGGLGEGTDLLRRNRLPRSGGTDEKILTRPCGSWSARVERLSPLPPREGQGRVPVVPPSLRARAWSAPCGRTGERLARMRARPLA